MAWCFDLGVTKYFDSRGFAVTVQSLPISRPKNSMNTRRITLLLCTAETLGMAGFALFAALLPQFQVLWGLSNTEAGWIGGGFFLGYMLAVPVLTGPVSYTHLTLPTKA